MASSYDNDLRLNEMATGDQSGAWGTVTNLNLEMIAEAFSYGTRVIANAAADNITLADGALDADRSMYLRLSGGGQACTVTFLPATISKVWLIENATSATLTMKQGSSPAGIAIPAGQVKMIATDGGGSTNGVVYDLLTDVNLAGTTVTDNLTVGGTLGVTGVLTGTSLDISGNVDIDGTTNLDAVDIDGAVQVDATVNVGVDDTGYDVKFFGDTASAYMQWDASADDLILGGAAGLVVPQDKLTIASTAVTSTAAELNQLDAITRGSILYGNASGATARLAKGGANTVLTSDGTDISWSDGPPTLTRGEIIYSNPSGTTAALAPGTADTVLTSDGTDISWAAAGSTFTLVASVNTTSGTAIDFTGLPSGVNRVTLNLVNVRTSSNQRLLVQLGDSGGIETSEYIASSAHTAGGVSSTNGFPIIRTVTSNYTSGIMILTRVTGNQWASTHSTTRDTSGTGAFGGGHKTLSGELTQLRLTRLTSGNFNQGNVSLSYE